MGRRFGLYIIVGLGFGATFGVMFGKAIENAVKAHQQKRAIIARLMDEPYVPLWGICRPAHEGRPYVDLEKSTYIIGLIGLNECLQFLLGTELHEEALRPVCDSQTNQPRAGIAFFAETSDGPAADVCESADEMVGWAQGIITLQGGRYPCNALLIYTFQEVGTWSDGKKQFTVELTQVILP